MRVLGSARVVGAGLVSAALVGLGLTGCSTANDTDHALDTAFSSASQESGVPSDILLAVAYNLTNWRFDSGQPNLGGGYGPMGLIDTAPHAEDNGKGNVSQTNAAAGDTGSTVTMAANAARTTNDVVRTDLAQNIRAAAMLLAKDARAVSGGELPADEAGWYPALATYAHSPSQQAANAFADDVFETLHDGITAQTSDGETLTVPAHPDLNPPVKAVTRAQVTKPGDSLRSAPKNDTPSADCPSSLNCRFVPAAYDWASSDHSDPNNYGNYDTANRPADGDDIQYIIIHDTETSYDTAIQTFENSADTSSANYVVRSSDGKVTQMVPNTDISWDVASWTINQHSISIEHEGYAAQGEKWYTPAMYRASADLVRYLAAKYRIPLDRKHIIAHEDVAGQTTAKQVGQHWDPGPRWDWQRYFSLLGAPIGPGVAKTPAAGDVVTINPDFGTNEPPLTTCHNSGGCTGLPDAGANIVYLRTRPSADAPLINDPLLKPDGSPGTTQVDDWSDKAVTGRQYVVAAQQNGWTAIWFDGQEAWFENPGGRNTLVSSSTVATVPSGKNVVQLYGWAVPERPEYPSDVPFQDSWEPTPLATWTFPAGQSYVVVGDERASNYYTRFDGANVPGNHTLVTGNENYFLIDYNHRLLFVRANDVRVTRAG